MNKTILIIEDNLEMRENTAEILELANYNVFTAENGKVGVQEAMKIVPDLIICDIMMPEMDGYETLYILSQNDKTKHIPFIFLTAKAEKSDWRKGMNMGADDYLVKPYDEMDLMKAVETRLKKRIAFEETFTTQAAGLDEFITKLNSIEDIRELAPTKKLKTYKKREILFHEGDYSGAVYFIESGKVKTFKVNKDGKEFTTGLYGKGDLLGHIAVLQKSDQIESAIAIDETRVCKISSDDFDDLLFRNKDVAKAFVQLLSGNLAEKEQELLNLAYNSVAKRVADGLISLKNKYQESELQQEFSMAIPRDDLASIVGTSTESVIRVLSDFKAEKWIEVKGSSITIKDEKALENLFY